MFDFTQPTQLPNTRFRLNQAGIVLSSIMLISGCQSTSAYSNPNSVTVIETPTQHSVTAQPQNTGRWASTIQPLFNRARLLVEQETGEDLSDVTLRVANDNVITKEVTHETHRLIHNQFNNRTFADKFLDSVMQGQAGTYAALYATRTGEIMVSEPLLESYQQSVQGEQEVQQAALQALLIHELVHAADDKRYRIHENRDLNFRASFAQSAAFEGHAQFVTRNICKKANCLSGLDALEEFMFGSRNPPNKLTQPVQAVSRNVLEYSYIEGERFVTGLAAKPNGQQLIDNLLRNPPQDPIQILDPDSYPNTQREQSNQQLISISTGINHPWLKSPWTSVQTSPLKGVNLRTDPSRRNAAVDGFTRLITSMVALQLYDQSQPTLTPIELTVIKANKPETAQLFAKTLHQNTRVYGAELSTHNDLAKVSSEEPAMLYMTKEPTEQNSTYYTLVGVYGLHVIQIAGVGNSEALFVDYIDQVLSKLAPSEQQASITKVRLTR